MTQLLQLVHQVIQSNSFFLATLFVALGIKLYLLIILVLKGLKHSHATFSLVLLLGVLFGSIMGDVSWTVKLIRKLLIPSIPYEFYVVLIRLSWASLIIQYQSLALFIESLTKKNYHLGIMHRMILTVSGAYTLYFLYLAFFDQQLVSEAERNLAFSDTFLPYVPMEVTVMRQVSMYLLPTIILPNLFLAFKNIKDQKLPKILKHQLSVLIKYLLCPFLFAEFIVAIHMNVKHLSIYESGFLSISSLLISYSIYYCIKKVIGLRFLNINHQLHASQRIDFINNLKEILEQLSKATSTEELKQITQTFFKEAFGIAHKQIVVVVRDVTSRHKESRGGSERVSAVEQDTEQFLTQHPESICEFIERSKILMYDELAFTNFYDENDDRKTVVTFLEKIRADIFLPIYQKKLLVGYIIIQNGKHEERLYTSADRDEMIIFSTYISTIINLLNNRNLATLIQQEKEIKDEIYLKHQEMNLYKESIRSFLKNDPFKDLGIIFYKHGNCIIGNQAAQEIVKIDLKTQEGHPITKALKAIGHQVEQFKIPKTILYSLDDTKLVLTGMLNLEKNNVIILVHTPEISDLVKKQIELLKDPSSWDYLLYLETTQAGTLISQSLPGSGESFVNFKLELFKAAISKKALLVEAHEDDLAMITQLIHLVSVRDSMITYRLMDHPHGSDTAVKLFGSNPLLSSSAAAHEIPLMQKVSNGTLYIHQVHLLDPYSQEQLANYLKTGLYRPYLAEQQVSSSARIIVSSNQHLSLLTHEGQFSAALYNELKKNTLSVPSLYSLNETEFSKLIDDLAHCAIKTDNFKSILVLSEKEKQKLLELRPVSISELKRKIHSLLIHKSKKNNIYDDISLVINPEERDPDILQAARMGKYALKDERIMLMLWNKFKNQNKIATFLGVNRSSVNRRFRAYNFN